MRRFNSRSVLPAAVYMLLALFIVACGGGGSGSAPQSVSGGTGSVAIAMTDGPAEDFDEINVTVAKTELLCDSGRVTVYEGSKTFDLLDLADKAEVFAIRNGVPAGHCSKIRLTLTEIELVKKDGEGKNVENAYPKLPGNGKLDLVPRGDFTVHPDETLMVQIDMDAEKSIHIVGTGSGKYQFRPVVFVDVMSEGGFGKLVRLHGVIEDIDDNDREFELCETRIPVRLGDDEKDHGSRGCIQVDVEDSTSIFDQNGQLTGFGDLVEGDEATVYGKFRRESNDREHEDRKEGDRKEEDREDEDREDEDNDDDSYDLEPDGRHLELDDLELAALVVELGPEGTFRQLRGVARSAVDSANRFTLDTLFGLNGLLEPAPGGVWNFDSDAQGWTVPNQTVTHNPVGTLTVTQDTANAEYYSPPLADIDGALYRYAQVRLRKVAGTISTWEGFMYWVTEDRPSPNWSDSYRNDLALPAALEAGEWVTLTWDMHNPTSGGDDWKNGTIKQIRFDLSPDVGPVFEIDWVVVGRRASDVVVQLQPGTKIVNRFGETLDAGEIDDGVPLMADGVLDVSVNPQVLYAALIVIDSDAGDTSKLSGTLGVIPDGSCGLSLITGSGDRSAKYDAYTRAYLVSGSGSQPLPVAALPEGFAADVYGVEAIDGCFDAETIIAFQ